MMYRPNDGLFGELFDEMRRMRSQLEEYRPAEGAWPPADVHDGDDAVVLELELPGVAKEDLDIAVEGRHLTIRGEKHAPREEDGVTTWHRERRYGAFERSFQLGFRVDRDNISADYQGGVLTIRLPKAEEARPRRIEVKAS